ncbi:hypothetical protein PGQ11_015567 [Apiospora arundinis]|uniref:Uncharacterized protein n=1 Tax=Apiospora arundinis TaxID=335852 RepID=A0ABR2HLR0_9PEZI
MHRHFFLLFGNDESQSLEWRGFLASSFFGKRFIRAEYKVVERGVKQYWIEIHVETRTRLEDGWKSRTQLPPDFTPQVGLHSCLVQVLQDNQILFGRVQGIEARGIICSSLFVALLSGTVEQCDLNCQSMFEWEKQLSHLRRISRSRTHRLAAIPTDPSADRQRQRLVINRVLVLGRIPRDAGRVRVVLAPVGARGGRVPRGPDRRPAVEEAVAVPLEHGRRLRGEDGRRRRAAVPGRAAPHLAARRGLAAAAAAAVRRGTGGRQGDVRGACRGPVTDAGGARIGCDNQSLTRIHFKNLEEVRRKTRLLRPIEADPPADRRGEALGADEIAERAGILAHDERAVDGRRGARAGRRREGRSLGREGVGGAVPGEGGCAQGHDGPEMG